PVELKVKILAVNDPPVVTGVPDVTVLEDYGAYANPDWAGVWEGPTPDEQGAGTAPYDVPQKVTATMAGAAAGVFKQPPAAILDKDAQGYLTSNDMGLSFLPAPDANGLSSMTLTVKDNGGQGKGGYDKVVLPFTVQVVPVNDAPTFALPPLLAVAEDAEPVVVHAFATGIGPGPATALDEAGQELGFTVSVPTGYVTKFAALPALATDGTLTFELKPDACVEGLPVAVTLSDDGGVANGGADQTTKTFELDAACVGDAPHALADSYIVVNDAAGGSPPVVDLDIVTANDQDGDGLETLTLSLESVPKGTLTAVNVAGLPPMATYQPPSALFSGEDAFVYRITDAGLYDTAVVDLFVECPGFHAVDDGAPSPYMVAEDASVQTFAAANGLLANDKAAGAPSKVEVLVGAAKGTVAVAADGGFAYAPHPNSFGDDAFTYMATYVGTLGQDCLTKATAHIGIAPSNDPPQASDDGFTVEQGAAERALAVLSNDSPYPDAGEKLSLLEVGTPLHGKATLAGGVLRYTPEADFLGHDSFTYTVWDGQALPSGALSTDTATVTVEVTEVNAAPMAAPDAYLLRPGQNNAVTPATGVLTNDVDPEGDAMFATLVDAPQHGDLVLHPDGSFRYVSADGFVGHDSFRYAASDGRITGREAIVELTVAHNLFPVAAFDTGAQEIAAGVPLAFFDRSLDPDGQIREWAWTTSDGGTYRTSAPVHVFAEPGPYEVILVVVDDDGAIGMATAAVLVTEGYALQDGGDYAGSFPVAYAGEPQVVEPGAVVDLAGGRADGGPIVTAGWRQVAGPEVTLIGPDAVATRFTAPPVTPGAKHDVLTFEFVLFDGHFNSLPDQVQVVVAPPGAPAGPMALAGDDRTVDAGGVIALSGDATGFGRKAELEFAWTQLHGQDIGREVVGAQASFPAPLPDGRPLVFELVATDGRQTATDTVTVLVRDPAEAIRAEPLQPGVYRLVPMVAGGYLWTFSDGSTSTEAMPEHTFAPGVHTVTLQVPWGEGGAREFTIQVDVAEALGRDALGEDAPGAGMLVVLALLGLA
ncbi:MAG TPA: Ig-like domain-containing protein, partial [Acidimicrobiia bacterium]|nr:Ig-like domain-containing protein [Acidimicrobiia bacterium]